MKSNDTVDNIRSFLKQARSDKDLAEFSFKPDYHLYFQKFNFRIALDECKEIILQEETGLELGGLNKKTIRELIPLSKVEKPGPGKIRWPA